MASLAHQDGPRLLGLYALAQAFALPIQYLSFLAIRQRFLTIEDGLALGEDFLILRAVVPLIMFGLALTLIFSMYANLTFFLISTFVFLLKYIEGFYDLIYAKMQKGGKSKLLAKVSIIRSLISALLFVSAYRYTRDLYVSMGFIALQQIVILITLREFLIDKQKDSPFGPGDFWTNLLRRLKLGADLLPFAISTVITSLSSSLPRLILVGAVGTIELGYFTAVISFISIGQIAVGSVGQSLLSPLSQAIASHNRKFFWACIIWPTIITIICCGSAAVLSHFIGSILIFAVYGAKFGPAVPLLLIGSIAAAPYFSATLFTAALFSAHMKYSLVWNQLAALFIVLILTVLLIPKWGVTGVFVAMGISGLCQMVLCFVMLSSYWKRILSEAQIDNNETITRPIVFDEWISGRSVRIRSMYGSAIQKTKLRHLPPPP